MPLLPACSSRWPVPLCGLLLTLRECKSRDRRALLRLVSVSPALNSAQRICRDAEQSRGLVSGTGGKACAPSSQNLLPLHSLQPVPWTPETAGCTFAPFGGFSYSTVAGQRPWAGDGAGGGLRRAPAGAAAPSPPVPVGGCWRHRSPPHSRRSHRAGSGSPSGARLGAPGGGGRGRGLRAGKASGGRGPDLARHGLDLARHGLGDHKIGRRELHLPGAPRRRGAAWAEPRP